MNASKKFNPLRLFSIFAPLRKIGTGLLLSAGAAVAVLFISLGLLIDVQALAVFLSALGAGLGVLIVSLTGPKWFITIDKERQAQLERELQTALVAQTQAAAELERLKSQRLQIDHVQTALKITLLEVDTTITDFKRQPLGSREKTLGGAEALEYVGVLRKKAKIMLGVDLTKLSVEQEDNVLRISGLQAEFQGLRSNDEEWLFRQVQVHEDNLLLSNKIRISEDSKLLMPAAEEHRKELQTRLESGPEFLAYDIALRKMAEQWLHVLLSPLGYQLVFSSTKPHNPVLLTHYLEAKSNSLQSGIFRLGKPATDMST